MINNLNAKEFWKLEILGKFDPEFEAKLEKFIADRTEELDKLIADRERLDKENEQLQNDLENLIEKLENVKQSIAESIDCENLYDILTEARMGTNDSLSSTLMEHYANHPGKPYGKSGIDWVSTMTHNSISKLTFITGNYYQERLMTLLPKLRYRSIEDRAQEILTLSQATTNEKND